jgi:hypothetical protein
LHFLPQFWIYSAEFTRTQRYYSVPSLSVLAVFLLFGYYNENLNKQESQTSQRQSFGKISNVILELTGNGVVSTSLRVNTNNHQTSSQCHLIQPILCHQNQSPFASPKSSRNFPASKLTNSKTKSPLSRRYCISVIYFNHHHRHTILFIYTQSKSHYDRLSSGKFQIKQQQQSKQRNSEFIQRWTDDESSSQMTSTHPHLANSSMTLTNNNNQANFSTNSSRVNMMTMTGVNSLKEASSNDELTQSQNNNNKNLHVTIMPLQVESIIDTIEPINEIFKNSCQNNNTEKTITSTLPYLLFFLLPYFQLDYSKS